MSLRELRERDPATFDLLSVDIFDTLLLRDQSVQSGRFREMAHATHRRLAAVGIDLDAATLHAVRCQVHRLAYASVSLERPHGDVSLSRLAQIQAALLDLGEEHASLFVEAELEVEARRLTPNRSLITLLAGLRASGRRVVAVSDMYLSKADVGWLLRKLLGEAPVAETYMSSDLGLTKHSGRLFAKVSELERVATGRILHCGDNQHSDVTMARAAGCQALLLARPTWMRAARAVTAVRQAAFFGGSTAA